MMSFRYCLAASAIPAFFMSAYVMTSSAHAAPQETTADLSRRVLTTADSFNVFPGFPSETVVPQVETASDTDCLNLTPGIARMVSRLETLGYRIKCGNISYPDLNVERGDCSHVSHTYLPNASTCYGVYYLPNRRDGTPGSHGLFRLDKDEAVLALGTTPPKSFYYGNQTYLFARDNRLASDPPASYVDIYASVGPAVNQRTIRTFPARIIPLTQIFSRFAAIVTTANRRTEADVVDALAYLFSPAPQQAARDAARAMTNAERLPVNLLNLGTGVTADVLQTTARLTPFKDENTGRFNEPAIQYMVNPPVIALRISPVVPRIDDTPSFYTLAEVPLPPRKVSAGEVWEQTLFTRKNVPDAKAALQVVVENVIADGQRRGLALQLPAVIFSPSLHVEGRFCIAMFEVAVQTGNPDAVENTTRCLGDSSDAFYSGAAQLTLPPGGQIAVIGVNHASLGFSTYNNLSLQSPAEFASAMTNMDLDGSAEPFSGTIPPEARSSLYVVFLREACGAEPHCIEAPAGTFLTLTERVYLTRLRGTKPDHTDVFKAIAVTQRPQ